MSTAMPDGAVNVSLSVLVVGVLIVLAIVLRTGLRRIGVPPLIGFILLGFGLRALDTELPLLSGGGGAQLELLAQLGVFALLFRVGLESNLRGLVTAIPSASIIWLGNMIVSGIAGYLAARYWLEAPLVPSLVLAVALTATSVGVGVSVFQDAGQTGSRTGALFIDTAELDDLSAVLLMILLFSALPVLNGQANGSLVGIAGEAAGIALIKALLFGALCYAFAHYAERRITGFMNRFEPTPDPMLMIVGIGIIIAAIAGLLGFSLAIGALFAGLVFSRDPLAVRVDASFGALYELFVPFFFIGIGLSIDLAALPAGAAIGGVLIVAAVAGKLLGAGLPAIATSGFAGAAIIGVSMVPRAEIAMVIMGEARRIAPDAVPDEIFAGMVVVSLVTCLLAPLVLKALLARFPQPPDDEPR
jgi:Kef-type K+ transport system membrane component KefB